MKKGSDQKGFPMLGQALPHGLNHLRYRLADKLTRFDTLPSQLILSAYRNVIIGTMRKWSTPLFGATAMVSITYKCQCRCPHCGSQANRAKGVPELSDEQILDLIDQCGQQGVSNLYLFGGEPLLHPSLDVFTTRAKKHSLKVSMDTNGLLLDENRVRELKALGMDHIRVSMDNADPGIHDSFRGIKGIHEKAIKGILACKDHGIRCDLSVVATKENLASGDFQGILKLAEDLGVRVRLLTSIACGGWQGNNNMVLSPNEIQQMKQFLRPGMVFWESDWINAPQAPFSCPALDTLMFHVTAHGDVQPCCYMEKVFGNINTAPLSRIVETMWRSDLLTCHEQYHDCPVNKNC